MITMPRAGWRSSKRGGRAEGANCYPDTHYSRALAAETDCERRGYDPPAGLIDVETCVIGGGLAGIATALDLAERGRSVALLEARRIGWGASGRNGGFVSDGYQEGVEHLQRLVGPHQARVMHAMTRAAVQLLRVRIEREAIPCGPCPPGVMRVALAGRPARLQAWRDRMAHEYGSHWDYWPAAQVREALATDAYADALLNRDGFAVQPLALAHGLAAAARRPHP